MYLSGSPLRVPGRRRQLGLLLLAVGLAGAPGCYLTNAREEGEGRQGDAPDEHGVDQELAALIAPERLGREGEKEEEHQLLGALVSGDGRGREGGREEGPDRKRPHRGGHGKRQSPGARKKLVTPI